MFDCPFICIAIINKEMCFCCKGLLEPCVAVFLILLSILSFGLMIYVDNGYANAIEFEENLKLVNYTTSKTQWNEKCDGRNMDDIEQEEGLLQKCASWKSVISKYDTHQYFNQIYRESEELIRRTQYYGMDRIKIFVGLLVLFIALVSLSGFALSEWSKASRNRRRASHSLPDKRHTARPHENNCKIE